MCSYFTHFVHEGGGGGRPCAPVRYYKECATAALPGDPKTAPPSYRFFIGMVERLRNV